MNKEPGMNFPHGVVPPVLTPFNDDLSVDVASAERHMSHLRERGVGGLFVLGSNGEGYDLDRNNRRAIVRAAKNAAGGQVAVYAGCMGMGTSHMLAQVKDVEDLKPDALVIMLPCYRILKEPQAQKHHFLKIKQNTACRLILYNLPSATGTGLDAGVVLELAEDEQFVGLKDTSGDTRFLSSVITGNPKPQSFGVLVGYPWLSAYGCLSGASGIVPSTANIDAKGAVELVCSAREGRCDSVLAMQTRMNRIREITECFGRELSMKQILVWQSLYTRAISSTGDEFSKDKQSLLKDAVGDILSES
jgi:4-hydroxy-tetrahydrodipicolinate synthase